MGGPGEGTAGGVAGAAGHVPPGWLEHALLHSSDLVLVIDPRTTITWCNASSSAILGIPPEAAVGRSLAEFLHPDDLERAAEVVALAATGAFDASPITPALYRVGSIDGAWVELEVNASAGPDGSMLVIGRVGGDLVLTDRLLEAVSGGRPFEEQAALVLELGRWRHPGDSYVLRYRDEDGSLQAITAGRPPLPQPTDPEGPAPWQWAIATGAEVLIDDLAQVPAGSPLAGPELVAAARASGFVGCLAVPVPDPGHVEGAAISIWTSAEGPTTSGHRYAMSTMRRALALVLQQRAQLRGLERATRVDHLTGAISRSWFLERLDQVHLDAHPSSCHTLLYVDLDGFKAINDGHGHAAGDVVLRTVAGRISSAASPDALVARLGGDEFAVLCPSGTTEVEAGGVAQRIVEALALPIDVGAATASIGASVGVAVGRPGDHPELALDAADAALLLAKAEGRGRWRSLSGLGSEA